MLDEFRSTLITWDKATSRIYSPVTANESDENGRKLVVQIVNSGQVEDLTGATLHLYWETRDKLHDGLDVFDAVDLKKGEFELSYTTGMLSNRGALNANLVLIDTVGRVVSERFKITVTEGIDNDAIQSENSFSSLTQALIDISNLEQNYAPRLNDLTAQLQQKAQQSDLEVQRQRLDSYTKLAEGSTTGDAELIDGRVDPDGVVYNNVGGAIRAQTTNVNKILYPSTRVKPLFKTGTINPETGAFDDGHSSVSARTRTNLFWANRGLEIVATGDFEFFVTYYSTDNTSSFFGGSELWIKKLVVPNDCYAIVTVRASDNRNITAEIHVVNNQLKFGKNEIERLDADVGGIRNNVNLLSGKTLKLPFKTGLILTTTGMFHDTNDDVGTRVRTDLTKVPKGTKIKTKNNDFQFYIGFYSQANTTSFTGISALWIRELVIQEDCYIVIVARASDNRNITAEVTVVAENIDLSSIYNVESLHDVINSKSIAHLIQVFPEYTVIADSLGAGFTNMGSVIIGSPEAVQTKNNWPGYLSLRTGRTFNNISVGGSTARDWRITHIGTADIESDCYLVRLGVNDVRQALAIGTTADIATDRQNNANSFYGNYDYVIRQVMTYNPKAKVFVFTLPSNENDTVNNYNAVIRHVAGLYANVHLIDLYDLYYDEYRTGFLAANNNGHLTPLAYNYESVLIEKALNDYLFENYSQFVSSPYA